MTQNVVKAVLDQQEECSAISERITHVSRRSLLPLLSQNVQLLNWLMLTGEEQLLENTTGWHDNTWGDCSCPKCKNITGQNLLGKALMEVRASFAPVGKFDLLVCYDELHPREEIIKDVSNYGVVDNTYYYIKDGKRHVITDRLLVFGRTDFFRGVRCLYGLVGRSKETPLVLYQWR